MENPTLTTTLTEVEDETHAAAGKAGAVHAARLNHLQALEAESISILREAVAEFARPVMRCV